MSAEKYYVGVDVGTGSVRASLLSEDGMVVASSEQDIQTWRDEQDHRIFEQSAKDIWSAISRTVRSCLADAKISSELVKGLGFDATCSLAVSDLEGEPLIVTKGDHIGLPGERNIVLWADHRAEKETDLINNTGSPVLDYVGGRMSVRTCFHPGVELF
jgi:ribulose kinase